jgi:sugar phosphate isomerase/epimerase
MNTNNYSRKDFLKLVGLGAASITFSRCSIPGWKYLENNAAPIAFQLYTVRGQIEKDLEGTIRKIAEMGFLGVETYPLPPNITLEQAAKVFKENRLTVISMHTELPVGSELENIFKMSDAYQSPNVIYPGWPKELSAQDPDLLKHTEEIFKTSDKTKQRADLYNTIGVSLDKKHLNFGLHNHWWEFEKSDGIYPIYYFLEHLDPKIFFEIDTYWAKTAGYDPAKAVADFGKRVPFLHIKDGPAIKGDKAFQQVPAGTGVMDFSSIVHAGGKNTQWMIVEFDEYAGNIFDGLQSSYNYLTKNHFAKGNI